MEKQNQQKFSATKPRLLSYALNAFSVSNFKAAKF